MTWLRLPRRVARRPLTQEKIQKTPRALVSHSIPRLRCHLKWRRYCCWLQSSVRYCLRVVANRKNCSNEFRDLEARYYASFVDKSVVASRERRHADGYVRWHDAEALDIYYSVVFAVYSRCGRRSDAPK